MMVLGFFLAIAVLLGIAASILLLIGCAIVFPPSLPFVLWIGVKIVQGTVDLWRRKISTNFRDARTTLESPADAVERIVAENRAKLGPVRAPIRAHYRPTVRNDSDDYPVARTSLDDDEWDEDYE